MGPNKAKHLSFWRKKDLFAEHQGEWVEKAMATHSSVLAWRIPGTGESGGLPSMGSQSRTPLKRLSSSSSSKENGQLMIKRLKLSDGKGF